MLYKAIVSFSGKISMASGGVREITDSSLADDLLRAGYIIPLEAKKLEPQEKTEDAPVEAEKPKTRRKGKKDGS